MIKGYNNIHQFLRFGIVGVGNTAIDFALYISLTRVLGVDRLVANALSVAGAMLFSYFCNKCWTFRSRHTKIFPEAFKFLTVNVLYYVGNNALFFIFVSLLKFPDISSKIIVVGIGLIWNFFAHKHWTFSKTTST